MATAGAHYPAKINYAHEDASMTLNHTCLRVKDPKVTVAFYEKHFGMKLHAKKDFPDAKFSLYFLGMPSTEQEVDVFGTDGILELTHNWGSENDPDFKVSNGNEEPYRGFGHVCITVADMPGLCSKLEADGVKFQKKMSDGRQKDIAFALDPDGYWIELVSYLRGGDSSSPDSDVGNFFNHTMVRVKDPQKSLEFYQNVLGMKVLSKSEHANAKFTLYFLGYPSSDSDRYQNRLAREGVLELTHNWGTEDDPNLKYHNGNEHLQGYGHICVSCKDPAALCREIEDSYGDKLTWSPKFNQGKMKNLAFLHDPDGYYIEIVPHGLKL